MVAGNPERVIRKRFDDKLIHLLERVQRRQEDIEEINDLISPSDKQRPGKGEDGTQNEIGLTGFLLTP